MGKRKLPIRKEIETPLQKLFQDWPVVATSENLGIDELTYDAFDESTPMRPIDFYAAFKATIDTNLMLLEGWGPILLGEHWKETIRMVADVLRDEIAGKDERTKAWLDWVDNREEAEEFIIVIKRFTAPAKSFLIALHDAQTAVIAANNAIGRTLSSDEVTTAMITEVAYNANLMGDYMARLSMHRYQRSVEAGSKCLISSPLGAAARRHSDEKKLRTAQDYEAALIELMKQKPYLGKTEALNQVAAKFGVNYKTVTRALRNLPK